MSFKLENFYEHIKKSKTNNDYPNKKYLNIDLPFRMIIVGSSGSGKTNICLNLIKGIGIFDKFVLLAKDLEEKLYQHLINTFREIEIKLKHKVLLAINDVKDLPSIDDFDATENNLLIVDDMICCDKKELAKISEFWIRGRKKSISMMFLSQNYYGIPKLIRQNSQYCIFKRIETTKDIKECIKNYGLSVSTEELMALYEKATNSNDKLTSFFLIDTLTSDPNLRFRNGFQGFNSS